MRGKIRYCVNSPNSRAHLQIEGFEYKKNTIKPEKNTRDSPGIADKAGNPGNPSGGKILSHNSLPSGNPWWNSY